MKDEDTFKWIKTNLKSDAFPHLFDAQLDAKINKDLSPPYQRSFTVDIDGMSIHIKSDNEEVYKK